MGANVAMGKHTTESSSVAPFTSAQAVNGNSTSAINRWVCTQLPGWMKVDLGEYYWINRLVVKFMGLVGWDARYNIKGYSIEGSADGNNWSNIYADSGNTSNSKDQAFGAMAVRYVRFTVNPGWGPPINPNIASIIELEVYEADNDPYLRNLTISTGTLTPAFNKKTFNYTAEVESTVGSVTVTPTADAASGSTIKVNNTPVTSGQASGDIVLVEGKNTITVAVTNNVTQNYTIEVTQKGLSAAYLSNLEIKSNIDSMDLVPNFAPNRLTYDADALDADKISVRATLSPGNYSLKINGSSATSGTYSPWINIPVGTTPIPIEVIPAGGGSSTTYTIRVSRSS